MDLQRLKQTSGGVSSRINCVNMADPWICIHIGMDENTAGVGSSLEWVNGASVYLDLLSLVHYN